MPFLPGVKRIMISLPESLLEEVDGLASSEQLNRSEFIRKAMKRYIDDNHKKNLREQMKQGYREMAEINLSLAAEGNDLENEAQESYEEKLTRCK